jgi:hypothetical protein
MKHKNINLSNALFVLYFLIPVAFYGTPYFALILNAEDIRFHFYSTLVANGSTLLVIFVIHFALGLFIYLNFRNVAEVERKSSNVIIFVGVIFGFVSVIDINSYLTLISFNLFVVILSNYKPSIFLAVILLGVGSLDLLLNESRNFLIWVMLLVFLQYANVKIRYLIGLAIGALFAMIFILQPMKNKISPVEYLGDISTVQNQIVIHLAPIFLTAIGSSEHVMSPTAHLSEMVPGLRLLTGESSVVDSLSEEHLPTHIYKDGTRLGSNSALIFDSSAIYPLIACLLVFFASSKYAKYSVFARNSIMGYLIIYGPYFIRRSVYSYVYDLILLMAVVAIILLVIKVIKLSVPNNRLYDSDFAK